MTPQVLPFGPPTLKTLTDKVEALFRRHPNTWLDVMTLADLAGIGGWRTRVSEVRHRGFTIEQRLIKWPDGRNRSQYCYRPAGPRDGRAG